MTATAGFYRLFLKPTALLKKATLLSGNGDVLSVVSNKYWMFATAMGEQCAELRVPIVRGSSFGSGAGGFGSQEGSFGAAGISFGMRVLTTA